MRGWVVVLIWLIFFKWVEKNQLGGQDCVFFLLVTHLAVSVLAAIWKGSDQRSYKSWPFAVFPDPKWGTLWSYFSNSPSSQCFEDRGGGSDVFLFLPRFVGRWSNLTSIFLRWVEITSQGRVWYHLLQVRYYFQRTYLGWPDMRSPSETEDVWDGVPDRTRQQKLLEFFFYPLVRCNNLRCFETWPQNEAWLETWPDVFHIEHEGFLFVRTGSSPVVVFWPDWGTWFSYDRLPILWSMDPICWYWYFGQSSSTKPTLCKLDVSNRASFKPSIYPEKERKVTTAPFHLMFFKHGPNQQKTWVFS